MDDYTRGLVDGMAKAIELIREAQAHEEEAFAAAALDACVDDIALHSDRVRLGVEGV